MMGLLQLAFAGWFNMKSLSPAERKLLKSRAHALRPVVTVGNERLSPALLKEIDISLKAHDLIKIRVTGDDRDLRQALLGEICSRTGASPVQHIGKILVVYQPQEDVPEKKPAKRKGKPLSKKQLGSR